MDKIILGYLMICKMSAYDLKTCIKKNLSSMVSASSGSIYAALNKLKSLGLIGEESDDKDPRDKKMYFITDDGRKAFQEWITEPMRPEKAKNIELAKLFFGGLTDNNNLTTALKGFVDGLKKDLNELETIKANNQYVPDPSEKRIFDNQMRTLEFGIANLKFQIEWFNNEIKKIEKENE